MPKKKEGKKMKLLKKIANSIQKVNSGCNSPRREALFTDPDGDSCFSIYQISWIKMTKIIFCKLKTSLSRYFFYNLQTFGD